MPHFNVREQNEMTGEIAARWRPYLTATGINTKGWSDWEIYSLSAIVWDNEVVFALRTAAAESTHTARMEACETNLPGCVVDYPASLPDPLPFVQALPEKHKASLRRAVWEAKARLVLSTRR